MTFSDSNSKMLLDVQIWHLLEIINNMNNNKMNKAKIMLISLAILAMISVFSYVSAEVAMPPTSDGINAAVVIDPAVESPITGNIEPAGLQNPDPLAPVTGDSGTGGVQSPGLTPPTASNGGNGVVENPTPVAPVTGGTDNSGAVVSGGSIVTPVTPSGGGSSSSSGSSIYRIVGANTATTSCPLITTYMKFGGVNNVSEVTKLQSFLKNSQGINVPVNGIFDLQTENAVKAFQNKYLSDIMGPWSSNKATGVVYITTKSKINQLACNKPLVMSASDLSVIEAYKSRNNSDQSSSGSAIGTPVIEKIGVSGPNIPTSIGLNKDGSQTASVVNAPVLNRVWNFIVGLFK